MSTYRNEVRVTQGTVHRLLLSRMGTTIVDVAFYPDRERGTTNGSISIHGDFGPFSYFWSSTGRQYFHEFLRGTRYDYAMTKLAGVAGAYHEDWSTLPGKMKEEVLRLRKEEELTRAQARVLYDYFDEHYLLDTFAPQSYEEARYQMEVELYPDMCRKARRPTEEQKESEEYDLDVVPDEAMYGGDTCCMPEPDSVRAEPYFWDEVWPVIVDEVAKLELSLDLHNQRALAAEDCPSDGA